MMNEHLQSLNQARWPFTPLLHLPQFFERDRGVAQILREQICSRHCILNRQIDPYSAGRGHRMRSVTDAKQSFAAPFPQTIDLHGEQFNL